jgi:hypothetical protein
MPGMPSMKQIFTIAVISAITTVALQKYGGLPGAKS